MEKHKSFLLIDYTKCPPCSTLICIGVCPFGVLEVGANSKPQIIDIVSCTGCGVCVSLCPANAITVNQDAPKKASNRR